MATPNAAARGLSGEGTNSGAFTGMDWLFLIGPAAIWGSSFALIAVGLDSFPPTVLTFLRLLFGFVAISLVPKARKRIARSDWPRVALVGVFWMAVPLSMFSLAEQWVSSSTAGMINGATPITALLVATLALHRRPGRLQLLGILVGFVGIVFVALPDLGKGSDEALGVLLLVIAVSCYGIALNLTVPLQQRYGSLPVFWRAQIVALALTAVPAALHVDESTPQVGAWLALVVLGVLGTGLAFVLAGNLAGRVGGARASIITYLIPPWSIMIGVLFLDETVAVVALVGTAVVLCGAFLATRRDDAARPSSAASPGPEGMDVAAIPTEREGPAGPS